MHLPIAEARKARTTVALIILKVVDVEICQNLISVLRTEVRRMDIVAVQVQLKKRKRNSASISLLDFSGAIFYATHRVELESFLAPHKNKPGHRSPPIGTTEETSP